MAFDDLYQEIILDHYRNPQNFGEVYHSCTVVEEDNPVCGDQIRLMIVVNADGLLQEIKFKGSGCAISMASASMMTEAVKGKPISTIQRICSDVIGAMRGEKDPQVLENYGDLVALKGVIQFPARVKCATLAWHALEDALKEEAKKFTR